ncbi:DC1 [Arabidopsis suecica]|uniref:DC1 n=1 Tax=Arabidopsis suecica TaxID=45249 RepID=A0A8T2EB43_ARASU|nr:DC1 [Arabidopsis suecica]
MEIDDVYTLFQTRGLKCAGCNLGKDYYSDGYCCFRSGLFFHKECAESNPKISSFYHPQHSLYIKILAENEEAYGNCKLCRDDRFPYACNLCNLSFHKDCAESTPEMKYSCHPKHILKRLTRVPSVDINCAKNPLPSTIVHLKAHEHLLTLMPQRNFVCDACGMDDDPNPYVCLPCNFMIHQNCIDKPSIIKIYRHDHRLYYNHCLDAGDWKCGVCNKEINWTCGAYSCSKCPDFAIHPRCVKRFGIWDGIELEGIPENNVEVKSYELHGM